jgi:purine-binding chemotaxis protein CheW
MSAENAQYLTFMLDRELFAIGILAIKEIIGYGNVTIVPMMPDFVRGVINLRGAVVPVIDLAMRFQRKPAPLTKRTCIVITEVGAEGARHVVGVVVDAVNEVLDIPASEIEPAPTFGAKIRADFIRGLGKVSGRFVILLDMDHVLSVEEMSTLASAEMGTGLSPEAAGPER